MDELPPPFVEGDYIKSVEKNVEEDESNIAAEPETSAISSLPQNNTVTVIPGREGHQDGSNSWIEILFTLSIAWLLMKKAKKSKKKKKFFPCNSALLCIFIKKKNLDHKSPSCVQQCVYDHDAS